MHADTDRLEVVRKDGKIYSHVRDRYLVETPEEAVRQEYLTVLVNDYGYSLDQISEEEDTTGRGAADARADFIVWRSAADRSNRKAPLMIVEVKADYVTIGETDYMQGELYARQTDAPFYVTHNNRETKHWRVLKDRMPGYRQEIEDIPHAGATDAEIDDLLSRLKTFKEKEFADLLRKCHDVIRNSDHLDPADAFDEIAKILFVKVYVERQMKAQPGRDNLFTTEVLNKQFGDDPLNDLFDKTRRFFRGDRLFPQGSKIKLKRTTGRQIVGLLEAYNLSDTQEDVKGIAFERFLGRTFRGENLGQFFTPRQIVEFMIRMVEPNEGDVICDPACGSGGFLIRFFDIVRDQILDDLADEYEAYRAELAGRDDLDDEERARLLKEKEAWMEREADQDREGSRMWALANRCIYGTDANERAAQAAKMNMIMHGDGHGGVHHHNGFLNVNGVFEGRFDIILTNPPFGANVERSARVTRADVQMDAEDVRDYERVYGEAYKEARARVVEAADAERPIGELFDLGTNDKGKLLKAKTEILFIERCLDLLKPGGRMGIVLPEGVLNNPSLQYVRDYCEDRARIAAVVSLPQDTFLSTGATVKASLLFVHKHTEDEQRQYDRLYRAATHIATREVLAEYRTEAEVAAVPYDVRLEDDALDTVLAKRVEDPARTFELIVKALTKPVEDTARRAELRKELRSMASDAQAEAAARARSYVKARWPYYVFLYDADRVGITATGEEDLNELFPNARQPEGTEGMTTLEVYRDFRSNPEAYLLGQDPDDVETEAVEVEA